MKKLGWKSPNYFICGYLVMGSTFLPHISLTISAVWTTREGRPYILPPNLEGCFC